MAYATINKPEDYFKSILYTGQNPSATTVSVGFKSDFLWLKSRTQTYNHYAFDTTRGGNSQLNPNTDAAESTSGDNVTFNATSFVANTQAINEAGQGADNMISWSWKANGGTTSSNTNGSITSTVQADTTAGFSIVTYTGTGATATVGHGLGTTPNVIIAKNFTNTGGAASWPVYHHKMGNTHYMKLDTTAAQIDSSGLWNDTSPTSSVFTINTSHQINASGGSFLAYCFTEIQGYSKFGSYTGNNSADGPFIYTGFKPAWVMVKRSSDIQGWVIWDNKRPGYNLTNESLTANETSVEETGRTFDILSNGFKLRDVNTATNAASTYIYMAFAQNPFVATNAVPTTAR